MTAEELGVVATPLDPNEKVYKVPFAGAGGLNLFLRYFPASTSSGATQRPAVLYAHGARLASAVTIAHRLDGLSWRDDLAAAGWDVWALDYVGYGGADRYPAMSEPPEANPPLCRAEEASQQIECATRFIVEHSRLKNVSVIAHSWGTNAAGLFAARCPELVDRLVMFGPITYRPGAGEPAPFVPAWQYITVDDWWKTLTADVPSGEQPVLDESQFKVWAKAYLACDSESGDRSPESVKTPWGALTDLAELWGGGTLFDPAGIKSPTLIIRGNWDSYSTDADAKWLFDALKRAPVRRDIKIGRATHFMLLEENRFALYHETRTFLAGDGPSPRTGP